MKKWMVLALSLLMVVFIATNSTLAQEIGQLFQTLLSGDAPQHDADQLSVELVYHARQGDALVQQEQSGQIFPAYYADSSSWDTIPVSIAGNTYYLWDDSAISGVMDKFVAVKNTAVEPAYVCTAFAVDANAFNMLKVNFNMADGRLIWAGEWRPVKITGRDYWMITAICDGQLLAGQTTPPMLLQVAMDKNADSADYAKIGNDFLQIKAMAVEADAFVQEIDGQQVQMEAADALELALGLSQPDFNPFR